MTIKELEARLAALEKEVQQLRKQMPEPDKREPWWISEAGRFENDPIFEEILRLGREYRDSLRPGRRAKKANAKKQKATGNGRARS